jgi:hypothetical protein
MELEHCVPSIPLLDTQGYLMHIILVYGIVSDFITNHLKTHYLNKKIFINSSLVLKLLLPSQYIGRRGVPPRLSMLVLYNRMMEMASEINQDKRVPVCTLIRRAKEIP